MEEIIAKVKEMISAPSCCAELKEIGQNYLDAVGTDKQAEAAKVLIAEMEEDIIPIDGLVAFMGSDMAVQIFGAEGAKEKYQHALDIKAAGAVYCDCPACAACEYLLNRKAEL